MSTTIIQQFLTDHCDQLSTDQTTELVQLISEYEEIEEVLYEIIGLLKSSKSFKEITRDIRDGKFGWKGSNYTEYQNDRKFKDNMLMNPPEITEGEIECPKCSSTKTLVVEMQTRSADEGFTYSIHCFNPSCKAITK